MKNKNILISIAVIGGIYAAWRFLIKPQIIKDRVKKQIEDYDKWDEQREFIAQSLPQETQNEEIQNII